MVCQPKAHRRHPAPQHLFESRPSSGFLFIWRRYERNGNSLCPYYWTSTGFADWHQLTLASSFSATLSRAGYCLRRLILLALTYFQTFENLKTAYAGPVLSLTASDPIPLLSMEAIQFDIALVH